MAHLNVWQIIKSVAASAFGVQSEQNRQRDFQQQSPLPYIVVGVIFVVLFILLLFAIVNWLLT